MDGLHPFLRRRVARAFTLVELLVVVSVMSILVGVLLPALAGARDSARQVECAATQRQLATGILSYGADQLEWIPGYATSGRSLWWQPAAPVIASLSKNPAAPTQVNDWMSVALRDTRLPRDRNERLYHLLERAGDPAMNERVPVWLGGGDGGNAAMVAWMQEHKKQPASGVSFLMPANFQLFGEAYRTSSVAVTPWSSAKLQELMRTHTLPRSYTPRLTSVGSASRKVMFADGFRYIDGSGRDFDASWSHQNWGSFSERSPCDVGSRAWGRAGAGRTGFNLTLSYRHRGLMNAAFYDGHVALLSVRQSRDPVLWAPTGSTLRFTAGINNNLDPDTKQFGYDAANTVLE